MQLLCIGVLGSLIAHPAQMVVGKGKANSLIVRCGYGYSVFVYTDERQAGTHLTHEKVPATPARE